MTDRPLAERTRGAGADDAARLVRAHAERLPAIAEHDGFDQELRQDVHARRA